MPPNTVADGLRTAYDPTFLLKHYPLNTFAQLLQEKRRWTFDKAVSNLLVASLM